MPTKRELVDGFEECGEALKATVSLKGFTTKWKSSAVGHTAIETSTIIADAC